MMRYSVILFDLDGTILNTLDDLAASTNRALAKNGLPTRSTEEVRRFVGNGIRLLIERAVPSNTPLTLTDRVFDDFRADYAEHCADRTLPYDGIPELLRALRGCAHRGDLQQGRFRRTGVDRALFPRPVRRRCGGAPRRAPQACARRGAGSAARAFRCPCRRSLHR